MDDDIFLYDNELLKEHLKEASAELKEFKEKLEGSNFVLAPDAKEFVSGYFCFLNDVQHAAQDWFGNFSTYFK